MNKKIKEILEIQEDIDYKKLSIEDIMFLQEYITDLEKCYCNRTDCSGRIKNSKKFDSLQQRIDKAIEYIKENSAFLEDDEYEVFNKKELLDILQGSDKEWNMI